MGYQKEKKKLFQLLLSFYFILMSIPLMFKYTLISFICE